jgi:hypothetical protein
VAMSLFFVLISILYYFSMNNVYCILIFYLNTYMYYANKMSCYKYLLPIFLNVLLSQRDNMKILAINGINDYEWALNIYKIYKQKAVFYIVCMHKSKYFS